MAVRSSSAHVRKLVDVPQVSVCPGGVPTGYTYFIPQEEHLESRVVTRAYMESRMVVHIAGRCEGHERRPSRSTCKSCSGMVWRLVHHHHPPLGAVCGILFTLDVRRYPEGVCCDCCPVFLSCGRGSGVTARGLSQRVV